MGDDAAVLRTGKVKAGVQGIVTCCANVGAYVEVILTDASTFTLCAQSLSAKKHQTINHEQYAFGAVHTNTVESAFFAQTRHRGNVA